MAGKMSLEDTKAQFNKMASQYEALFGGTTRGIAAKGMKYLPALTPSTHILDSACGPGIVTKLILEAAAENGVSPSPHVTAIDLVPGMIEQLELNKATYGWNTVEAKVMNAQDLTGLGDETFDAVYMNFGIFAVPDADKGAKEILRVLKPGGVAIVTTWKKSSPVVVLEDVVGSIRPDCVNRVFPISKDWLKEEKLRDTLLAGGFKAEKVDIVETETVWESTSVATFVDVMSGPFWAKIQEGWSDEEKAKWRPEVEKRAHLNDKGLVSFPMIAWMGVATK